MLLALHLVKSGDCVTVTVPDGSEELIKILQSNGIEHYALLKDPDKTPVGLIQLPRKVIRRLRYISALFLWLRKKRPDVVYLNTTRTLSELVACKLAHVRTILHVRGFDSRFPIRYLLCLWADRIVVLNQSARRVLGNFRLGLDRVRVVPNGVAIHDAPAGNRNDSGDARRILYVGGYEKRKGTPSFLKLASGITDSTVEFHHIGDPTPKDEVTQRSLEQHGQFVIEHGVIADVPAFIETHGFEYFMLLSESEGMPRSLLEAMERGLVPIVSRIPEHSDIVTPDVGFLFDTNRFDVEFTRLNSFIRERDIEEKSKANRALAIEYYDIEICNSTLRTMMSKIC